MTQNDIQLLLQDICSRLPYGVKVKFAGYSGREDCILNATHLYMAEYNIEYLRMKPYLRPMSSMTVEERQEYGLVICGELSINQYDWLNAHHFDYRGLIEKGLAIEAPEDIYN